MARRAYGAEDKQARRRAILEAAAVLFVAGSGELPTVAEVATAAGLAKGTVYLYFRTKEAIFSALLQEGWDEVIGIVKETFAAAQGTGGDEVRLFLARFVAHVAEHPELLRLDALGHGVLMKNLEPAALKAYKTELFARVEAGAVVVERALGLPPGRGAQLLTRTYGLTRGLWQSFDETVSSGVEPPHQGRSGFPNELAEALDEYWRGALADTSVTSDRAR